MTSRLLPLIVLALLPAQAQETPTIEAVAADRALWPPEVTVTIEHEVPVVINGRQVGSSRVPAGRAYPVKAVRADGVQVEAMGSTRTFAVEETDLLTRAAQAQTRRAAAPPPPPPPAADAGDAEEEVPDTMAGGIAAGDPGEAAETEAPGTARAGEPAQGAPGNAIAREIAGDLVILDGRRLKRIDGSELESKQYLAVYFSAAWCGPCRNFTPKLVEWYNQRQGDRDKFEVILMSRDHGPKEMENYIREDKMPWPAIAYNKRDRSPLAKYAGRGIPCLVVIDGEGNVLSHSYEGKTFVGPSKVLKDLEKLLGDS